ncbi:uncharacterized protein LOC100725717 [Cavia porcellus]|uniref:uncharacterized protein LOC100725717 n=1 Tax=Cavia porcellus TaxID=10141 RepID=UPI002FE17FCA
MEADAGGSPGAQGHAARLGAAAVVSSSPRKPQPLTASARGGDACGGRGRSGVSHIAKSSLTREGCSGGFHGSWPSVVPIVQAERMLVLQNQASQESRPPGLLLPGSCSVVQAEHRVQAGWTWWRKPVKHGGG